MNPRIGNLEARRVEGLTVLEAKYRLEREASEREAVIPI